MPESQQPPLLEISSEISRIYKANYGRGPKSIRTYAVGDAVVCLLEGVNAPAQAALLDFGKPDLAQAVHGRLQMGMADQMSAAVERFTGRTVRGYIPGYNAEIDATTDVFYLEPSPV
jgi:uncharacterized protein YbcI